MKRKNLLVLSAILILSLFLPGFGIFDDITLARHAQKKEHHEIIKMLQPSLDQGDQLSSWRLFFLAGAYYEIRDYHKAITTIELMQKRVDQGDRSAYGADISVYPHVFRGYIYLDQGEPQKAVSEGEKAFKLLHSEGRDRQNFYRSELISICDFWGVALELTGRKEEARKLIDILHNVNSSGQVFAPEKYIALARIYMAKKDYANALASVRNPEAKVAGMLTAFYDQTFQEIPKLYILSKSLFETGNLPEAREGYDQLLGHPQIEQIGGIYWVVLLDRAKIALATGQQKTAEDLLKKAIEVIEKQRSSINSEAGRIGFVGDKQDAYAQLVDLLLATGRYPEAFAYVERAKARALVDLLASQKNIPVRGENIQQVKTNLNQLAQAENELAVVSSGESRDIQNKTRSVIVTLKKELLEKAPETAALVTVQVPTAAEIQSKLKPDETLLEYYTTGKSWYVFILTPATITAQKLTANNLVKDIDDLRRTITFHASGAYKPYAEALYRQLFAPIIPLVKTKKLIVVGHGPLHYLPISALADGKDFLIDHYSIRTLPSASVLSFLQSRTGKFAARKALILGNPKLSDPKYDLAFAQDEALAIEKILPGAKVLLRSEATASYLMHYGDQYPLIHLAAHGTFNLDEPLASALLLAPDKNHNGLLRAADLYNLSLHADLVTLSACETALGKVATGDDVVGFTRGFLYAGANSLVSSLWQVDDRATRDLMVSFYSNLKEMKKDEALRQAQIHVKKRYPHPYFWAAFVLTGSGE
ncbi:MAG: hypothetical protein CVU71_05755 [Deltaproteobacteria bacterium HGW-Deltaproteobacteria-6]|nr:MAG: hypothetical protein CVU71_05755 [Deltaproteobacteria bacterium HGW-Deltaproteobacteria-6]